MEKLPLRPLPPFPPQQPPLLECWSALLAAESSKADAGGDSDRLAGDHWLGSSSPCVSVSRVWDAEKEGHV
ncbi:hypothetical protein MTO96_008282 [Rhipicephalus appendiculatus]